MIEKQENTPDIVLNMPDPECLLEAISDINKEHEFIDAFRKSIDCDEVDEIIEKMNYNISILHNQLSEYPVEVNCYKTEQQRKCDEYFFIQRTNTDVEKSYILNAFVIARDILINNKIDNYLSRDQVNLSLNVMSNLLSYTLARGELNECG